MCVCVFGVCVSADLRRGRTTTINKHRALRPEGWISDLWPQDGGMNEGIGSRVRGFWGATGGLKQAWLARTETFFFTVP